jgi:hypothetical protein
MRYVLCALIALSLFSCKSTKNIEPNAFEGRQIRFGSGGGFTGAVTQWALLDNGRLWGATGAPNAKMESLAKVSKKGVAKIFSMADSLDWSRPVNAPGNMYRFVELHDGSTVKRMTWDPYSEGNFMGLNSFFETLKPFMEQFRPSASAETQDQKSKSDDQ